MDIAAGKAGLHLCVPSVAPTCRAPLMTPSPEQRTALDNATRVALDL